MQEATTVQHAVERLVDFLETGSWDLTADLSLAGDDPLSQRLDVAWRQFREAVLAAVREQEEITGASAASAARNSIRTRDMQRRMSEMQTNMHESVQILSNVVTGAREAATGATRAEEAVQKARAAAEETARGVGSMASDMTQVAAFLTDAGTQLGELGTHSKKIEDLSQVVKGIAKQVNLLSLNASIEAARAGAHGRGFAVVASEVRRLAEHTARQAGSIEAVVRQVSDQLEQANQTMTGGVSRTRELSGHAGTALRAAEQIGGLVTDMSAPVQQLATVITGQSAALAQVSAAVVSASESIEGMAHHVDLVAEESQALLTFTRAAQTGLAQFYKGSFRDEILRAARRMAGDLRAVFEGAVQSGQVTMEEILALEYTEIKGEHIQGLRRIFDVSRVPPAGFQPPKFSTRYDRHVDLELREVLDRYLNAYPRLLFVSLMDVNGYQPIATSNSCRDWTGEFQTDAMQNRLKRFTTDEAQLEAARMGLERIPVQPLTTAGTYVRNPNSVLPRSAFARLGYSLKQADDPEGLFSVRTYSSLSGRVATQVAVPIYAGGYRYGAALIGWEPEVGQK